MRGETLNKCSVSNELAFLNDSRGGGLFFSPYLASVFQSQTPPTKRFAERIFHKFESRISRHKAELVLKILSNIRLLATVGGACIYLAGKIIQDHNVRLSVLVAEVLKATRSSATKVAKVAKVAEVAEVSEVSESEFDFTTQVLQWESLIARVIKFDFTSSG